MVLRKTRRISLHHLSEELFPLKQYKLGELCIMGPNNPKNYLDAYYGDDWEHTARFLRWHTWDWLPETVILTDADKMPAQPTTPLLDRTAELFQ